MNIKAQGNIFLFLMLGVVFIVLALALVPGAREVTNEAMTSSELNCSDPSISDQNKAVCDSMDIQPFLYGVALVGLAGILLKGSFG